MLEGSHVKRTFQKFGLLSLSGLVLRGLPLLYTYIYMLQNFIGLFFDHTLYHEGKLRNCILKNKDTGKQKMIYRYTDEFKLRH